MARQLKRFTDEQIERANRVDVVEYARSVGLEIQRNGSGYKAKGMQGLIFKRSANIWHWESENTGGRGAISLCMKLEGKSWIEAVKTLLNEDMEPIRHTSDWKPEPEPPKEFHLPDKNNTYRHVVAYLTKTRGIDSEILKEMIEKGYVYENIQKSCVFVGRDKDGVAKHASVRSTNTYGKVFKQDVPGSQKEYSFSITGTSQTLNVFEAPIDALSYMSLLKLYGKQTNDSYLALGGVTDKALERFLSEHPDIEKIRVCTDNDIAGEKAVSRFYEKYSNKYKITRHRPTNKDFNEDLVSLKYSEEVKQKDIEKKNEEQSQSRTEMLVQNVEDGEIKKESIPELNEAALQGMDSKAIQWYKDVEKNYDGMFSVKGSCNLIIICDSPEEIIAHANINMRYFEAYGEKYIPDEHYAIYNSRENLQKYLSGEPKIDHVFACTSRTEAGEQSAKEIENVCKQIGMNYTRTPPQLTTYAEDLSEMKVVSQVLEQTPMNSLQELDMAAGMEL